MVAVLSYGPTLSGLNADPIDQLMLVTCGSVLRLGDTSTGEYDELRLVSTRTRRRLAGARLVSTSFGLRADQLHAECRALVPRLADMNADEFVAWYVGECVRGLDWRAAERSGSVRWEDQQRPDDDELGQVAAPCADLVSVPGAPAWWVAWVLRTVHAPKADYIVAVGRWAWASGPLPELPSAPWAIDVLRKFHNRGIVVD